MAHRTKKDGEGKGLDGVIRVDEAEANPPKWGEVLRAVGAHGPPEVLGFRLSRGEGCAELLWDLRRRGLEGVGLFVSDDSGAVEAAIHEVYPEVPWQSCTWHRLVNLWTLIGPKDYRRAGWSARRRGSSAVSPWTRPRRRPGPGAAGGRRMNRPSSAGSWPGCPTA